MVLINRLGSLLKISAGRDLPSLVLNVESKMADAALFWYEIFDDVASKSAYVGKNIIKRVLTQRQQII